MNQEKVIKKFSSCFDDELTLVEVVVSSPHFIVRVLGESDMAFPDEHEALNYAEQKASEF